MSDPVKLYEITVREFPGHAMRVGVTQDAHCAGHDAAAIMRDGGWKSIGVLARYLDICGA